jgi:Phosphoenolpyruvate-dependent sugar phosphotransferase system, EIIA 2
MALPFLTRELADLGRHSDYWRGSVSQWTSKPSTSSRWIVFLLLLPEGGENPQVNALASIARTLSVPGKLERIRAARNPEEIFRTITEPEGP